MWDAENSTGIDGTSVLKKTVCLELKTSVLGTLRKVSTDKVEVTPEVDGDIAKADKALLKVSKRIIDSPELTRIMSHINGVRLRMRQLAVPTTIFRYGCYGMPVRLVDRVDEILGQAEREFNSLVSEFVAAYPRLISEAAERLGELYNPVDYPTPDQVRKKFTFTYSYSTFDVPSTLANISGALFEREREKAAAKWSEAGGEIRDALRAGFAGMVEHMCTILAPGEDGKPKTFKKSSVDGFKEFLSNFEGRNVTDDAELGRLVDQARRILDGATIESLRRDEPIRERLLASFEEVKASVAPMVIANRREIHFEDEV
jgi:hypothetical protein